jgi:hypothetical protein
LRVRNMLEILGALVVTGALTVGGMGGLEMAP